MRKLKHYTESIYYEFELTAKVMRMMAGQFFAKIGMGIIPDEYVTLDVIACNNGICQRDLAKLILKDRANTGRLVSTLEEKGFITRSADTKNNRLVRKLSVTENGTKELKKVTDIVRKQLENTSQIISESEIDILRNNIQKFRASLEKLIELKI